MGHGDVHFQHYRCDIWLTKPRIRHVHIDLINPALFQPSKRSNVDGLIYNSLQCTTSQITALHASHRFHIFTEVPVAAHVAPRAAILIALDYTLGFYITIANSCGGY